jgi:TRAP-type C4-dicarboxylate transport system substrate-binding protein
MQACATSSERTRFKLRSWRTVCAAVVAVSALCAAPVAADDGRVASATPPGTVWNDQWTVFRETAGAAGFEFQYFVNGQLGDEETIITAVRRGRVNVAGVSVATLATAAPPLAMLLQPYLFESAAEVEYVYENHLKPVIAETLAAKGLVFLSWGEVGLNHLYGQRAMTTPDAATNVRLRGPTGLAHQAFLASVKADAVPIGLADLVPALQTKLIDGGMANLIFHAAVTAPYARHFTLTGHIHDTSFVAANKEWFDALPPARQQALRDLFAQAGAGREAVRRLENEVVAFLRTSGGEVHELTADERALWVAATQSARDAVNGRAGEESAADARLVEKFAKALADGKAAFAALALSPSPASP